MNSNSIHSPLQCGNCRSKSNCNYIVINLPFFLRYHNSFLCDDLHDFKKIENADEWWCGAQSRRPLHLENSGLKLLLLGSGLSLGSIYNFFACFLFVLTTSQFMPSFNNIWGICFSQYLYKNVCAWKSLNNFEISVHSLNRHNPS